MADRRTQITAYSVCTWGNRITGELWYGVRVRVKGRGWMHCCNGADPMLFPTRANAQKEIQKMKAERTPRGFKRQVNDIQQHRRG